MLFCRWFKHLSDATEAYQIKEGKPKHSDHSNETEEETVQELPSSSREATERAEPIGGSETQNNTENDIVTIPTDGGSQKNDDGVGSGGGEVATSDEDNTEKRLSQTDGDSSNNAQSAGEFLFLFLFVGYCFQSLIFF